MTDVANKYPYMIIGGQFDWATDSGLGGFLLLNNAGARINFANATDNTKIVPNVMARYFVDLTAISPSECYDYDGAGKNPWLGNVFELGFSFIGGTHPLYMGALWASEFDNAPGVTQINIQYIAFTDNIAFRAGTVNQSKSWNEYE